MHEIAQKKKLIVCHPLQLIFIKTKKTAGTSFEVALSKYCSEQCIVTPISGGDEEVREVLGFTGPQNFRGEGSDAQRIGNHSTASQIRAWLGDAVFFSYRKLTIHRDPLDFLVSQYFYRLKSQGLPQGTAFSDWVKQNQENVLENYLIAPVRGENRCDTVFNYEALDDHISQCDFLPAGFQSLFNSLNLKGNIRDESSRDINAFYLQHGVESEPILKLLEPLGVRNPRFVRTS